MIIGFCIGAIVLALIFLRVNVSIQFGWQVKNLFAQSATASGKTFHYAQLHGLPDPVQKYFRHVLKDGQAYVDYARLTHDGEFKAGLDKPWTFIAGEQYFTTVNPGFIWKGKTALFTARDMYIGDQGRLTVSLLSLFTIVDGKGKNYNEGELQRWLAESVWFPTNLLPGERLTWEAVDANTANLIFKYREVGIQFHVQFNEQGEIRTMETTRYMTSEKKEAWICTMADYMERNGIRVPNRCNASWILDKGHFPYAKFNVKAIEYGIPKKF